ncbi:MAG TPA: hypothetical protein VGL58_03155 [Caulobacteraceae bacterium]|jgi:hypothetical protein
MPLVRYALAAAAACLVGGAAYAQTGTAAPAAAPPMTSDQSATTPDASAPPADQAVTGQQANTSATVTDGGTQVIASQPVPDTPANRKAYGAPMSHAGKATAPTGD